MPKRVDPAAAEEPHDTGSVDQRLARLLDTPQLARIVPHLAPETLHQLIRYRGLDACGELVASATPEQLRSVLDLDLWRHPQPGHDERFDEARFGEWLELLVDNGGPAAARTVAAIDQRLVIAGLARYVRVFDSATFAPAASSDDEPFDIGAASAGDLECEVGGYLVRARRADAWDAIVTLLLALDTDHRDYFHAVMRGCRRLSNSTPEIDGLDDLLTGARAAAARRGARAGRPASRRATDAGRLASLPPDGQAIATRPAGCLVLAEPPRRRILPGRRTTRRHQPTAVRDRPPNPPWSRRRVPTSPSRSTPWSISSSRLAWCQGDPRRCSKAPPRTAGHQLQMRPLMDYVRDTDDTAYLARNRELAFLANTLMAGCSIQSRPFTAQEASDAAVGICNLGLGAGLAAFPTHAVRGVSRRSRPGDGIRSGLGGVARGRGPVRHRPSDRHAGGSPMCRSRHRSAASMSCGASWSGTVTPARHGAREGRWK